MRKLNSWKKVKVLQIVIVLLVATWKILFFIIEEKNCAFFLIFIMELSSAALSYLTAHSTKFFLNMCMFLNINTNLISKEHNFNCFRSSHHFRCSCWEGFWKCQACNTTIRWTPLPAFLRILITFFRLVFGRTSHNLKKNKFAILKYKKFTKTLKSRKDLSIYNTQLYRYFFVSDKIFCHKTNIGSL